MNLADELAKLQQLHQSGALSNDEFAKAKANLLEGRLPAVADSPNAAGRSPAAQEQETRQWAMLLHLSLLAGFVVPFAGLVTPIVIWQVKKNDLPGLDEHGKIVVNWIISAIIYGIVSFLLLFVVIGIVTFIALGICGIVFPIIGGIKANNGEAWRYPLSIPFFV